MLSPNFKNGEKLDLHSAFSLFVVMMGLLFLLETTSSAHTAIILLTIMFGVSWYLGHQFYLYWQHNHSHS